MSFEALLAAVEYVEFKDSQTRDIPDQAYSYNTSVSDDKFDVPVYIQDTSNGHSSSRSNAKDVHNCLEKKRRAVLKEKYAALRSALPGLHGKKKISNLNLLHTAMGYIRELERRNKRLVVEQNDLYEEEKNIQSSAVCSRSMVVNCSTSTISDMMTSENGNNQLIHSMNKLGHADEVGQEFIECNLSSSAPVDKDHDYSYRSRCQSNSLLRSHWMRRLGAGSRSTECSGSFCDDERTESPATDTADETSDDDDECDDEMKKILPENLQQINNSIPIYNSGEISNQVQAAQISTALSFRPVVPTHSTIPAIHQAKIQHCSVTGAPIGSILPPNTIEQVSFIALPPTVVPASFSAMNPGHIMPLNNLNPSAITFEQHSLAVSNAQVHSIAINSKSQSEILRHLVNNGNSDSSGLWSKIVNTESFGLDVLELLKHNGNSSTPQLILPSGSNSTNEDLIRKILETIGTKSLPVSAENSENNAVRSQYQMGNGHQGRVEVQNGSGVDGFNSVDNKSNKRKRTVVKLLQQTIAQRQMQGQQQQQDQSCSAAILNEASTSALHLNGPSVSVPGLSAGALNLSNLLLSTDALNVNNGSMSANALTSANVLNMQPLRIDAPILTLQQETNGQLKLVPLSADAFGIQQQPASAPALNLQQLQVNSAALDLSQLLLASPAKSAANQSDVQQISVVSSVPGSHITPAAVTPVNKLLSADVLNIQQASTAALSKQKIGDIVSSLNGVRQTQATSTSVLGNQIKLSTAALNQQLKPAGIGTLIQQQTPLNTAALIGPQISIGTAAPNRHPIPISTAALHHITSNYSINLQQQPAANKFLGSVPNNSKQKSSSVSISQLLSQSSEKQLPDATSTTLGLQTINIPSANQIAEVSTLNSLTAANSLQQLGVAVFCPQADGSTGQNPLSTFVLIPVDAAMLKNGVGHAEAITNSQKISGTLGGQSVLVGTGMRGKGPGAQHISEILGEKSSKRNTSESNSLSNKNGHRRRGRGERGDRISSE